MASMAEIPIAKSLEIPETAIPCVVPAPQVDPPLQLMQKGIVVRPTSEPPILLIAKLPLSTIGRAVAHAPFGNMKTGQSVKIRKAIVLFIEILCEKSI
jgi:hypothetical protein